MILVAASGIGQSPQTCDRRRIAAAEPSSGRLDHATTSQRGRRALLAQDERLAVDSHHGFGNEELAQRGGPVRQLVPFQQSQSCADLRGAEVETVAGSVTQ